MANAMLWDIHGSHPSGTPPMPLTCYDRALPSLSSIAYQPTSGIAGRARLWAMGPLILPGDPNGPGEGWLVGLRPP